MRGGFKSWLISVGGNWHFSSSLISLMYSSMNDGSDDIIYNGNTKRESEMILNKYARKKHH